MTWQIRKPTWYGCYFLDWKVSNPEPITCTFSLPDILFRINCNIYPLFLIYSHAITNILFWYDYYVKFYCISNNDGYTSHSDMCVTAGKYFPWNFIFALIPVLASYWISCSSSMHVLYNCLDWHGVLSSHHTMTITRLL